MTSDSPPSRVKGATAADLETADPHAHPVLRLDKGPCTLVETCKDLEVRL